MYELASPAAFHSCRHKRNFIRGFYLNWVRTLPLCPPDGGPGLRVQKISLCSEVNDPKKLSTKKIDSHLNKTCTTKQSIYVQGMFVSLTSRNFPKKFWEMMSEKVRFDDHRLRL
jgi:hypothetical protein